MRRILQIVPSVAPPEEAVAQAADRLSEAWAIAGGISSQIVAASKGREALRARLEGAPRGSSVLLHYVGYGYARRGAPLWLSRLLEAWIRGATGRSLVVHFHEVAASGPPWRSSFWLSPLQRRVAARIGRLARGAVTSLEAYAARVRRLAPGLRVEVLPIFSTIGEPRVVTPFRERSRSLALLGSPGARAEVWEHHRTDLEGALSALGLDRVVEIGRAPCGPPACGGRPVERLGELESRRVGDALLDCRAAFFAYPVAFLDKSSAFAAACGHGLLPVCCGPRGRSGSMVGDGERWLSLAGLQEASEPEVARIAAEARRWYEGHGLERHARTWGELLEA